MTVTRESRRMSRVTPPLKTTVTFAVSHDYPSRPVPTRPICSSLKVGRQGGQDRIRSNGDLLAFGFGEI